MLLRILIIVNLMLVGLNFFLMSPWNDDPIVEVVVTNAISYWLMCVMVTYISIFWLPPLTSLRFGVSVALAFATAPVLLGIYFQYEAWESTISIVLEGHEGFNPSWREYAVFHYSGFAAGLAMYWIDRKTGTLWAIK